MKIYFCEKCGISIPLQEVVGGRATARDGKTYCQGCRPGGATDDEDLKLYFCDNCKVSIPLQDVITNRARVEGETMLCTDCGRLSDGERTARREQLKQELKEKEESRYRLHFCDRCNTSIPQSHLVTGRAVIRGGRTYCERCQSRTERKKVGNYSLVLTVVFLAILAGGGYLLAANGAFRAKTPDQGPSAEERQRARILDEVESIVGRQVGEERDRLYAEFTGLVRELEQRMGTMATSFDELRETSLETVRRQDEDRSALSARLGRAEDSYRSLAEQLVALTGRLEELASRPAAEPARAAPPPVVPREPADEDPPAAAPEPEPEAPPQVKQWLAQLGDGDAGVRFAAAVELGKAGFKPAWKPLADLLADDKDTFVRRAAARSLGELDAWRAVPVLIETLEDKEFFVAVTAHKALVAITGQDFGFQDGLTRSQLRKVVSKARDWWDDHQDDRAE